MDVHGDMVETSAFPNKWSEVTLVFAKHYDQVIIVYVQYLGLG